MQQRLASMTRNVHTAFTICRRLPPIGTRVRPAGERYQQEQGRSRRQKLGGKFALADEDRPVLIYGTQARAERRALLSATMKGMGLGLALGVTFLAAGMSGHVADRAHAERMAEAATRGYAGSYLEAQGQGLRIGLERYGFRAGSDAETIATRFANDRGAAKARRRADLECMTEVVYYEARGESARGQAAVAQVVMNRVGHPAYPKSVCGVVFQGAGRSGCQFSFTCDGSMRQSREVLAWDRARGIAQRALKGAIIADIGRATHFHTTAVSPFWAPSMLRVTQVGAHVFYKLSPARQRMMAGAAEGRVVLVSTPAVQAPDIRLSSTSMDKAIEASLQSEPKPPSHTTSKVSEVVALSPQATGLASTS